MEKQKKSEEQLKTEIFSLFLQCKDEPSSDRRQVYSGQLWELISQWCNSYPFQNINAQEIGLEIFKLVLRIIKKNRRQNIPTDENGFFKYLRKALYHAKAEYYRTYESGSIKIPKEKMSKLKRIDEIILNRLKCNRGLEDLQDERTRNLQLKNNLTNIIFQLRNTYCVDLSEENFEIGIQKIQKSICTSEIQKF